MARKRSHRRPTKKTRKAAAKRKPVAKKKPAKKKPARKKAPGTAPAKAPVADATTGVHPIAYLTGGTPTLPAS
jgi:hypothetical protein